MIARIWTARADAARAEDYAGHFRRSVLPQLRTVPGFVRASLMARRHGDEVCFTVITLWRSMEAVKSFAGEDPSRAVVEPNAAAALKSFDGFVTHHEVMEDAAA
jgi:heme-degrading monooxygenase HmoA